MRWSLGTISAGAAWFTVAALMLFGTAYLYAIPVLVFAVPCSAAYRKQPGRFWKPFTLLSVFGAAFVTFFCAYGIRREIDGVEMSGFPLAYTLSPDLAHFPVMITNALIVAGACLLPLSAWSTMDTFKKRKEGRSRGPTGSG